MNLQCWNLKRVIQERRDGEMFQTSHRHYHFDLCALPYWLVGVGWVYSVAAFCRPERQDRERKRPIFRLSQSSHIQALYLCAVYIINLRIFWVKNYIYIHRSGRRGAIKLLFPIKILEREREREGESLSRLLSRPFHESPPASPQRLLTQKKTSTEVYVST